MEIKSYWEDTFNSLYLKYEDKVYNIALFYSGNHHVAEDITQTVFMTLYTNMENINLERVAIWLRTTAKHMALNYERDSQYECPLECWEIAEEVDEIVYEESVENLFLDKCDSNVRKELVQEIYQALYKKNKRWYEALTITYILEKPQKEVAKNMGITLGALELMLHRARKWIRKRYKERLDHLKEE